MSILEKAGLFVSSPVLALSARSAQGHFALEESSAKVAQLMRHSCSATSSRACTRCAWRRRTSKSPLARRRWRQ
jgi:hypothetical protein